MKRDKVKVLFDELKAKEATVYGWVRTNRAQSQFGFLNVNDGSTILNMQVVYEPDKINNFEEVSKFRVGMSSISSNPTINCYFFCDFFFKNLFNPISFHNNPP
jgi:aspartyl/asparaginyl-tRNA synthetase